MLIADMNFVPEIIQLEYILSRIAKVTTKDRHRMTNIDFWVFRKRGIVSPCTTIVTVSAFKNSIPAVIIVTRKLQVVKWIITCEEIISCYH